MQNKIVKKQFEKQANYYAQRGSAVYSEIIPLFLKWASAEKKKKLKVCEFGGAGGALLEQLAKKSEVALELFNIEIVGAYRKKQVSPKIKFREGSILKKEFPKSSLDCIIIRDVLHHLVGDNLKETEKNQLSALRLLKDQLKPTGAIFIEELITSSKISSRIIFWLSKINSKIGIESQKFEISPFSVVSFLTLEEMQKNLRKVFAGNDYLVKLESWQENFEARLIHLGAKTKKAYFVIS